MRNPWKKAATAEEAVRGAGVTLPELDSSFLPVGFEIDSYYYMTGMLEIRLRRDQDVLILRKTNLPIENVSGDYNRYPFAGKITSGDLIIHYRGTTDSVSTAVFETFGAKCSICINPGRPGEGLTIPQTVGLAEGMRRL